jgi:ADP-ribosylglycohydrolase
MQMRLKLFHEARAPLANGHRRDTLLLLSDEEFETNHGFIQWAFPTSQPSQNPTNAPVLDLDSAVWLAEKDDVARFLEDMTTRFLEFLKRSDHWKQKYNHNHLRVSRALESIRTLHSYELAKWFHETVLKLAGESVSNLETANEHWLPKVSPVHDRIAGAFLGLAIGDALGAPVEFQRRGSFTPVSTYQSGGKFKLPEGAWTDDTAMALALATSLIESKGFEAEDVLQKFSNWLGLGHFTSTGTAVGVGQNTLRTLGDYRRKGTLRAEPFGKKNDGNGSLMRLCPVPCFYSADPKKAAAISDEQSRTTHASDIAAEACQFLSHLLSNLLNGQNYHDAKKKALESEWSYPLLSAVDHSFYGYSDAGISSGGYVLDTLQAAIWAAENGQSFRETVSLAVNLGDDADTTAAVAGQIAGAMHGLSEIDQDLKIGLAKERQLYVTSQFLSNG